MISNDFLHLSESKRILQHFDLGSIFFLIHIDNVFRKHVLHYAHNHTLICIDASKKKLCLRNEVNDSFVANRLSLNASKENPMTYTLRELLLMYLNPLSVKYLDILGNTTF